MNENDINSTNIDENINKNVTNTSTNNLSDIPPAAEKTEGKKSALPYVVIGVCAAAALAVGLLVGNKVSRNKEIAAAQEYLEWESQNHTWVAANCQTPKTCSVCGATEGEVGEHEWEEATCSVPKTCKVCGATEGEALGHEWKLATLDAPKTCKNCGVTEGNPIVFEKLDTSHWPKDITTRWDYDLFSDGLMSGGESLFKIANDGLWNVQISQAYYMKDNMILGDISIHKYLWDGTEDEKKMCGNYALENTDYSFAYGEICATAITAGDVMIVVFGESVGDDENAVCDIIAFDSECNQIDGDDFVEGKNGHHNISGNWVTYLYNRLLVFHDADSGDPIWGFDIEKKEWINGKDIDGSKLVDENKPSFDISKYSYINETDFDLYFVSWDNKESWGFVDKEGNEIARYVDASNLTASGYSLVSDDRKTYDLIDKDFNVIKEDIVEGTSASSFGHMSNILHVTKKDGTEEYYRVQ
ncbi:MAG: hypothetical protein K6E68_02070 [Lachnospiraceae bacterium]|nr:hypothetical protein [Lachnospiraceae bacterium]